MGEDRAIGQSAAPPLRAVLGFLGGALISALSLAAAAGGLGVSDGSLHGPLVLAGGAAGALLAVRSSRRATAPAPGGATHGSAVFAAPCEDLAAMGGPRGLIVGRLSSRAPAEVQAVPGAGSGPLLRMDGPGHVLTIAPTRSGKGVGAVVPNLLLLDRSIICIDPKGENTRIALRTRRAMGATHVLDPFGISGAAPCAYNPLARLAPESEDLADEVFGLVEALVMDPPHQTGDAHWNEEARALVTGVILHVVTTRPPQTRTLGEVRRLLTLPAGAFTSLLDEMQGSGAAGGLVARAANRHLAKAEREAAGVLSSAQRHTHFLDSRRLEEALGASDFRFEDLKREVRTVFLVLPPERLASHARWLRLMVCEAIAALARSGVNARGGEGVLFLLDEFAALGRLEPVAQAFGLMAGYGVQLWAILQDLHQLRALYGRAAGTFLSNASVLQVFNVADIETAEHVSRALGAATVLSESGGHTAARVPGRWLPQTSTSVSHGESRRPLMTPDEVMRLSAEEMLLLRPGARPTIARKVRYYADGEFAGLFDGASP